MYNIDIVCLSHGGNDLEKSLEEEIEYTREAMVHIALKEGIGASTTIRLSKRLDILMNQFDMNKGKISLPVPIALKR